MDKNTFVKSSKTTPIINRICDALHQFVMQLPSSVNALLLFGSILDGKKWTLHSDIDICVIAPKATEKPDLLLTVLRSLPPSPVHESDGTPIAYDVQIFEDLPLYMQIRIINHHYIIYVKNEDIAGLYEYFYQYRKLWKDQKYRNTLSRQELLELVTS